MKLWNVFVTLILRSPLHGLFSKNTLLLTVTGRKSGRQYTTPVNYVREEETLVVISRRERTWWRNLEGGAQVTVVVQGRTLTGTAQATTGDNQPIDGALQAYFERLAPGRVTPEYVAKVAPDRVLVTIRPDSTAA
jgi:deazaflavin-dependent oxidoreductase (nitroreductase family)